MYSQLDSDHEDHELRGIPHGARTIRPPSLLPSCFSIVLVHSGMTGSNETEDTLCILEAACSEDAVSTCPKRSSLNPINEAGQMWSLRDTWYDLDRLSI